MACARAMTVSLLMPCGEAQLHATGVRFLQFLLSYPPAREDAGAEYYDFSLYLLELMPPGRALLSGIPILLPEIRCMACARP